MSAINTIWGCETRSIHCISTQYNQCGNIRANNQDTDKYLISLDEPQNQTHMWGICGAVTPQANNDAFSVDTIQRRMVGKYVKVNELARIRKDPVVA
jgi:hypothetical protein